MDNISEVFVSVIIPAFNNGEQLLMCLEALQEQTYRKDLFEIVVVDNNSTENIKEVSDKFSNTVYVKETARGPAAARNKGISDSKGEVLAFTDSDCKPDSNWLKNGVETIVSQPDCGLVGGKVELYYENENSPNPVELYDTVSYLDQKRYVEECHFAATANLFTKREVIRNIGVFLSDAFKGAAGEDTEWGRRVFRAGYKQLYQDKALVKHPAENSFMSLIKKTARLSRGNHIAGEVLGKLDGATSLSDKIREKLISFSSVLRKIWIDESEQGILEKTLASAISIIVLFVSVGVKVKLILEGFFKQN